MSRTIDELRAELKKVPKYNGSEMSITLYFDGSGHVAQLGKELSYNDSHFSDIDDAFGIIRSFQAESAASTNPFKCGDVVECVDDNCGNSSLKNKALYVVASGLTADGVLPVRPYRDISHTILHWSPHRFKLAVPTIKNVRVGDWLECTRIVGDADRLVFGTAYRVVAVNILNQSVFVHLGHGSNAWASIDCLGRFDKHHDPQDSDSEPLEVKLPPTVGSSPHPFWMVKGQGPTSYCHSSEESARVEAKRLATVSPGETFTVLGPVASYQKADLQCTDLRHYLDSGKSEAPF